MPLSYAEPCGRTTRQESGPTMIVSTTNEIAGYRIVRHLGSMPRASRSARAASSAICSAACRSIFGGKISVYVNLAEQAREEAYQHMVQHAAQAGANAVIGMRYDANEIMDGITEVLAYGTGVVVEPA